MPIITFYVLIDTNFGRELSARFSLDLYRSDLRFGRKSQGAFVKHPEDTVATI